MRIAFYSEAGRNQVVLTAETKAERAVLETMHTGARAVTVMRGSFYQCQGGYVRQGDDNASTVLAFDDRAEADVSEMRIIRGAISELFEAFGREGVIGYQGDADDVAATMHEIVSGLTASPKVSANG